MTQKIILILNLLFVLSGLGQNNQKNNLSIDQLKRLHPNDTLYIIISENNQFQQYVTHIKNAEKKLNFINDSLVKKGFLFNKIKPDSIILKKNNWYYYAHLKLNTLRQIDSIIFLSSQKTPKNIVKYFNRRYKHHIINKNRLNKLSNEIYQSTKLRLNNKPYINFIKGKNAIIIDLKKVPQNNIAGLLGFNYNTKTKKIELNGLINLHLYNVLNGGETFGFKWQKNQDIQELKFDIQLKKIKGSNLGISNIFYNKRKDTSYSSISDEIKINYHLNKHTFGINYYTQEINETNQTNHLDFIGLNYSHKSKLNFNFNFKSNSTKLNKYILYLNTGYTWHFNKNLFFQTNNIAYYNKTDSNVQFYNLTPRLFRKPVLHSINYLQTLSTINNIGYTNNKTNIFLIADGIRTKRSDLLTNIYINTGVGLSMIQKKQKLTIEIILPIYNMQNSDNQSIYINIKQTFIF